MSPHAASLFAHAIAFAMSAGAHAGEANPRVALDDVDAIASTIVVSTMTDDIDVNGNCSLREAVIAANTDTAVDACGAGNGEDTIRLQAGDYLLSLPGNESDGLAGDLDISSDVNLLGAGRRNTSIDGGGVDRVFEIFGDGRLGLRRVTIRGGGNTPSGAQIRVAPNGSLDASEVRITGTPEGTGAAVYVNTDAVATLRKCLVDSNLSRAFLTQSDSVLLLEDCTVRDNVAAGNESGAAIYSSGDVTIVRSLLTRNTAGFGGGAIISGGVLEVVNSTLVDNHCGGQGGAIYNLAGNLVIHNSTVARNTSGSLGAGILQVSTVDQTATTTLSNTILADNFAFGVASDCFGSDTIVSTGYSLLSSSAGCPIFVSASTDLIDVDPRLGALDNHGGETETVNLLSGSPAIDAGDPDGCRDTDGIELLTDQRGYVRAGRCDIGAYEVGSQGPVPVFDDGFEGGPVTAF